MRSNRAGRLVAIVVLAALGVWAFALRTGGSASSTAAPRSLGGGGRAASDGAAELRGPGPLPSGVVERTAGGRDTAAGAQGIEAAAGAPLPGRVDVYVTDMSGRALLDPKETVLPVEILYWLSLRVIEGEALPSASDATAAVLRPHAPVSRSDVGWYTAMERPSGPAHVALCFNETIVASARVEPSSERVDLIVDPEQIVGLECAVTGRIEGFAGAASHVKVRPMSAAGAPLAPILAEGADGRFEVRRIPPGRVRLEVGIDEGVMTRALLTTRGARDPLRSISLGARAVDRDQWNHRLAVLSELDPPFARIDLELAPGETRQLGAITTSRTGACLFALVDGANRPVDTRSVDIVRLLDGGDAPSSPVMWTYDNLVVAYPLPLEPSEFLVIQGDVGAFVEVQPTGFGPGQPPVALTVIMEPLALVRLPRTRGAVLQSDRGRELRTDARWSGGAYMGRRIDDSTMIVPAGRYRFVAAAEMPGVQVIAAAKTLVDLTVDPPRVEPLEESTFKRRR